MTITSRIVAAATLASALSFAPAAFADSPAPVRDHAAAMHDCARACDCARHAEKSTTPAPSSVSGNDSKQKANSWASRNG